MSSSPFSRIPLFEDCRPPHKSYSDALLDPCIEVL